MTEEKFKSYVTVQRSGITNMFDVKMVCQLSEEGLTYDDCTDIMSNYEEYSRKWDNDN